MVVHPVEVAVRSFMRTKGFSKQEPLLCAFSGGIDSTALLCALKRLGFSKVRAIHVQHGIRSQREQDAEKELVLQTCSSLDLPCTVAKIRPGAIANRSAASKSGIEAAAREFRYRCFLQTAIKFSSSAICVAHNLEDQLETVLGRFLSGSGLEGLAGMPEIRPISSSPHAKGTSSAERKNPWIIRPLLSTSRAEIEEYVRSMGLRFSTDSTNLLDDYSRNKLRHHLLPFLDGLVPGWRTAVLHASRKMRLDSGYIAEIQDKSLEHVLFLRSPKSAEIDLSEFAAEPRMLQVRILTRAAAWVLGKKRVSPLKLLPALDRVSAGSTAYYSGLSISRVEQKLVLRRALDFHTEESYFFTVPCAGKYVVGNLVLTAEWSEEPTVEAAEDGNAVGDRKSSGIIEGAFEFPIIVRTRRPGDSIALPVGMVRLDDVLKSMFVPPQIRALIPIIEDKKGIVAVMPGCLEGMGDFRSKFRAFEGEKSVRRLRLSLKGERKLHVR